MSAQRTIGAFAAVVLSSTAALSQSADSDANVAVRRVTLATGGLAHVEGGMTAPGSVMRLAIERPQVADVLRTLIVTGSTPVVSIDLPAAEPVGERSVTGRLLAGDLSDPLTVLGALIGETVELKGGPMEAKGRLLAFSPVMIPPEGEGEGRPGVRVAVADADGRVRYATFPSLDALSIEGDAIEARMADLVPALGESVDDGRRELSVRLDGSGEAGFSFVVPTTVWRPSYRALIGADGEVQLQGWATLENTTGLDWEGIDLRLAVGTPVAYQQDVYSPLRTSRPFAPFEVGRTAEAEIVAAEPADAFSRRQKSLAAPAPMASAFMGAAREVVAEEADEAAALVTGGAALAGTAATIFPVAGEIDLAAGRTLTVPFLSSAQNVARIAYLDLSGDGRPMDALEMSFDPDATVPGGLVAVYDGDGFVGDARFAGADGGEIRILPFALSSDVNVTMTSRTRRDLASASLRAGTLRINRELVTRSVLSIESAGPATLVADEASQSGDKLALETSDGVEAEIAPLNQSRARLRASIPDGASEIVIVSTRPQIEGYRVATLPSAILEEVLALGGSLDAETRAGLERVGEIAATIVDIERRIETAEADISDLREAVELDRENLEAIDVRTPEGAAVRQRIVDRTNTLDARLQELQDLRRQRAEAEASLNAI
ncbi:hypothetical protein [Acuticoccus kandeliae]|uniref:hypothetical protein n=1 Tax=Acuticoccus kandeliae TaxID=2073160 RepID=UPI000D3E645F|nr:hypothetical protein [Acuticoccus kandeliae]